MATFEKKFKKGWTMVELCMAMIALAILVGISIQALKPKKFLIGPFAYAGVKNLMAANSYIIDGCNQSTNGGRLIYGCEQNQGLPDAISALAGIQTAYNAAPSDFKYTNGGQMPMPALNNIDDPYCVEVAGTFALLNDTINCRYANGNNVAIKLPKGNGTGDNAGVPNFQTSNMVAYYHLESPWVEIIKGNPTEGDMGRVDDTDFYKQIFIDVNGNDRPNRIGEDQFPLRIYKRSGEIIPGFCGNSNKGVYAEEAVSGVSYRDRCNSDNFDTSVALPNWQETSYPFAYNLYRSYSDETEPDRRLTSTELLGVSYKEAACKGGYHNLLPRAVCDSYKNANSNKYAPETLYNQDETTGKWVLNNCIRGEVSAFCVVRISKPSMPGLFKLPVL